MRDQRISKPKEVVDAFRTHVLEMPQSDWRKLVQTQKCADLKGEQFEKHYRDFRLLISVFILKSQNMKGSPRNIVVRH